MVCGLFFLWAQSKYTPYYAAIIKVGRRGGRGLISPYSRGGPYNPLITVPRICVISVQSTLTGPRKWKQGVALSTKYE